MKSAIALAAFFLPLLAAGSVGAADRAWQAPFSIELPEPTRTITLRPRADAAAFAKEHGLAAARIVPMGRSVSALEMPMNDADWEVMRADVCGEPEVSACESVVCQSIQFEGSAEPGGRQSAEAIQARLVRRPPENVVIPDPANPEAGSCRGAPPVPDLDDAGARLTSQDLTIDLTLLDDEPGHRDLTTAAGAEDPSAAQNADSTRTDGSADDPVEAPASAGPDATAALKRSFEFAVTSRFNPVGGVDLGTDRLPADTSDWSLVVAAGCSEVTVPLNAIEPARLPGIVVAMVASADVAAVAGAYGLTVVKERPLTSTGENLVTYASTQNTFAVIAAMALDARVAAAQPEYVFETTAEAGTGLPGPPGTAYSPAPSSALYSDPFAAMNYAPAKTGALELQGSATGSGQLIAVIDTGIDVAHPDLAGRLRTPVDTTDNGYAAENHGTAVAGIIAAAADNAIGSFGVAPGAEILPIKACQPREAGGLAARCTTSTLVSALDVAISEGATIINMSLAGPPDDLVTRYVQLALDQGRLVVAGAGNGGVHAKPGYPAAIPGVLAVTAVDVSDGLYAAANRGSYIDVAAPGVDIVGTLPDGRYPPLSGTSMAAAHVTGIAALISELGPLMSAREVAMVIRSNTRDLGAPGEDTEFGTGLVDACRAASAATADAVSCKQGGEHADLSTD